MTIIYDPESNFDILVHLLNNMKPRNTRPSGHRNPHFSNSHSGSYPPQSYNHAHFNPNSLASSPNQMPYSFPNNSQSFMPQFVPPQYNYNQFMSQTNMTPYQQQQQPNFSQQYMHFVPENQRTSTRYPPRIYNDTPRRSFNNNQDKPSVQNTRYYQQPLHSTRNQHIEPYDRHAEMHNISHRSREPKFEPNNNNRTKGSNHNQRNGRQKEPRPQDHRKKKVEVQEPEEEEQVHQTEKKPDHIIDDPEEIRKWVEARKRNYPSASRIKANQMQQKANELTGLPDKNEISKLELKLRKQIRLAGTSPKHLQIKCRNMDMLRNIITQPVKKTKIIKKTLGPVTRKFKNITKSTDQAREIENTVANADASDSDAPPVERAAVKTIMEAEQQPIEKNNANSAPKIEKVQHLIQSLKQKKKEEEQHIKDMFNYKSNSANYKYMKNTLVANMLLEDIFKENSYLLQAIRYIVKHDFLEKEEAEEVPEEASEGSDEEEEDEQMQEDEVIEVADELEEGEI